jgi:dienelactone hydrolase
MSRGVGALLGALVGGMLFAGAQAQADPVVGVDMSCVEPAGDPAEGSPEWIQRDINNQNCAGLRIRDQVANPSFGWGNYSQGTQLYVEQTWDQLGDLNHPRGGVTTLIPGSKAADPFRSIKRWTETRGGRVSPVSFPALNGATLRGHVFAPPATVPEPKNGYPGIVITDGSIQAYEELYYWAAEDLAEEGYLVMTYDVQGQGDSDLVGSDCSDPTNPPASGECSGVPYQQNYNFYQGAEDSLSYFLSAKNPWADHLDRDHVGIAGHSLGAAAVSRVGQCDTRVKAIVAWDNLGKITDCNSVTIPPQYRADKLVHTPALALSNDYAFNTTPALTAPDPHAKDAGFKQLADAGVVSQLVVFRGATHLTYTYIPLVFQANELSERMASYYTTAWFDRYIKGDDDAFDRLVAKQFDDSADKHSIGAGVYDPALVDPLDRFSGNVPYRIKGIKVADAVSFYYLSEYALTDPHGHKRVTCGDVRKGC